MQIWALCLGIFACAEGQPETASVGHPLDKSWFGQASSHPERFTALLESSDREGWAALHRGDYAGALRGDATASPVTQVRHARANHEISSVYSDLALLAHETWETTFSTWETRSELPSGSAIPLMAALAAFDAGDNEAGRRWLERGKPFQKQDVAAVALALEADDPWTGLDDLQGHKDSALVRCLRSHRAVRGGAPLSSLECGAVTEAIIVEDTQSHRRELYDPLIYVTYASAYMARATTLYKSPEIPDDINPLASVLFSWAFNFLEFFAEGGMGTVPMLLNIDFGRASDDPTLTEAAHQAQNAREAVRALDTAIDAWRDGHLERISPDGVLILNNLQLVAVWRSRLLLHWSRQFLRSFDPHYALAMAQMTLDVEHGREIGPLNPPGLFVVLATGNLKTGRTREALDALQALHKDYPVVHGLDETLGDLAILQGIGRHGDSKEN